ncbi:hypothetical protein G9A89_001784 [Geosiphon pyriformis]|nr:hypothetical protein G9A89_001784 [Geosiphon pyriformis]
MIKLTLPKSLSFEHQSNNVKSSQVLSLKFCKQIKKQAIFFIIFIVACGSIASVQAAPLKELHKRQSDFSPSFNFEPSSFNFEPSSFDTSSLGSNAPQNNFSTELAALPVENISPTENISPIENISQFGNNLATLPVDNISPVVNTISNSGFEPSSNMLLSQTLPTLSTGIENMPVNTGVNAKFGEPVLRVDTTNSPRPKEIPIPGNIGFRIVGGKVDVGGSLGKTISGVAGQILNQNLGNGFGDTLIKNVVPAVIDNTVKQSF